jgi:hypothetical protein
LIAKRLQSLDGIVNKKIDFKNKIEDVLYEETLQITDILPYHKPSIIISETINIESKTLNIAINNQFDLIFKNRYIGIASKNNNFDLLQSIYKNFLDNEKAYLFQYITNSAQLLINRNTAILAYDLYNVRYFTENILSEYDNNIIHDVLIFYQDFLRTGENSKAVQPIKQSEFKSIFTNYGTEFSKVLNLMYENDNRKFRLSNVVELKNSLIATVFKYDTKNTEPKFSKNIEELNIENLSENKISSALSVNRIIKMYPQKDTIVFVKPNQYRYWLSLIAYRDADACFADFAEAGF